MVLFIGIAINVLFGQQHSLKLSGNREKGFGVFVRFGSEYQFDFAKYQFTINKFKEISRKHAAIEISNQSCSYCKFNIFHCLFANCKFSNARRSTSKKPIHKPRVQ